MIEIFSNSKINLALNPAAGLFNCNSLGRLFLKRSMDRIVPDFHFMDNARLWLRRNISPIKARHFEIPACGGFTITARTEGLGDYYDFGKEIVIYNDEVDLIDKIKYYLNDGGERAKIAKAGYERTLREHTYQKRFSDIFQKIKK